MMRQEDIEISLQSHFEMYAPVTPVKQRAISIPNAPYKRPLSPQRSPTLEQKEKWAASNASLKAKWAAANTAWRMEMAMQEQLSTFTLLKE